MPSMSEVADLYIILRAITKPFTDGMAKAASEGEVAGSKIGGSIGKVSPVLMGVAAATGIAMTASVKWASDFETQYTRLFTAAGASKDAVLKNRDAMLQLGTDTGFTGTQIAEALYHPVSAGFALNDALQMVRASAEEARISGANLDDTTFALSSVMRAFGLEGKNASDTMAQLNAIVGEGDMRFQDFNSSIKNWAPTAAAMHISIQSMGAGLAYLTDRGNSAEEASTRMTMGIALMATPAAQAAKVLEGLGVASSDVKAGSQAMVDVLKKAHVTQNELAVDLQKPDGLYVALNHLQTALHDAGVKGTEADSAIAKIFGGGRSDKAILSLLQNLQGLQDKYTQIGKDSSASHFQKNWEDAQKTTAVQFEKLKAQVINLGIQFGMVLLPPLKVVLKYITDGITWITHHKEAMIALAGVISGIVVVALVSMTDALIAMAVAAASNVFVDLIAALVIGAVEITTHWKQVKRFFEDLWAWFVEHKKVFEIIFAPLLAIVVPIALAIKEIIKHWQDIWNFMKQLGADFVQWGKDIARFFSHVWDDLKQWFSDGWTVAVAAVKVIWKGLTTAWDDTVGFFEKIWNESGGKVVHEIAKDWGDVTTAISKEWHHISDDLASIWGSLTAIWNAGGGKLVHAISEAMDWIGDKIHKHWNGIKDFFSKIWELIYGVILFFLNYIKGSIIAAWDSIKNITKMIWDIILMIIKVVWDVISGIVKIAVDVVTTIIKVAWDVIKGITKTVWDVITGIINFALDLIKDFFKLFADFMTGHWGRLGDDIKKATRDAWDNIYKLIQGFLSNILKYVVKIVKDIWNGFIQGIKDAWTGIWNALKAIYQGIFDFFKDAIHWLYQVGKDIVQGIINGVKDMAGKAKDAIKGIGHDIKKGFTDVLSILSPSKVFHGYGVNIVDGLINGMTSKNGAVSDALTEMAGPLLNADLSIGGNVASPITSRGALAPNSINIYVQGSVLTERDLRDLVQEQMLQLGARYSSSYTPYKR